MWLLQRTRLFVYQRLRDGAPTFSDTLSQTRQDNMFLSSVPDMKITDTEHLCKLH
jgi:hypothetical protein